MPDDVPWYLDDAESMSEGERLQKVLAQRGWGSRRACEILISEARVTVNGEVAQLGRRVNVETDLVCVDAAPIGIKPDLKYMLLNKPEGVVTTASDPQGRETVFDLVPEHAGLHTVGRLDLQTEGLLIITNDGNLTHAVTHPSKGVEKEYLVQVGSSLSSGALRQLREGVDLDDGLTAPAKVSQPDPGIIRIVIHEGRNRQVRRMFDSVGHPVQRLVRIRIGPIRDNKLSPGEWRVLNTSEVIELSKACGLERYAQRP